MHLALFLTVSSVAQILQGLGKREEIAGAGT